MNQWLESVAQSVQDYLISCEIKGLSPGTVDKYRIHLTTFAAFLRERFQLEDIARVTKSHIFAYIKHLQDERVKFGGKLQRSDATKGLSVVTINDQLRSLKAFFNYVAAETEGFRNPMQGVKKLKTPKKIVGTFDRDSILRLLSQPNRKSFAGFRDYVMIWLTFDSGCRLSELVGIKIGNVDLANGRIKVLGKGNKERFVPIGMVTKRLLIKYMQRRQALQASSGEDHLFVTQEGLPLKKRSFEAAMKRYGQKAGITHLRVSPHTLRHSFAKEFLLNGGDVFSLQAILGHTSLDMSRVYVNLANTEVQLQHRRHSPGDKLNGTMNR